MILGIPVVDGHDLTFALLDSLAETVTGYNFKIVIFDNNSQKPYLVNHFDKYDLDIEVINCDENLGYYQPLEVLYDEYDDDLIGLIHNDMVIYEKGWNERMTHSFDNDPLLGLVGLCGSSEIDERGGRGGGTVCYFRGGAVKIGAKSITGQSQEAGRRTTDLVPSACLDSLFMMFRREAIPDLVNEIDTWDNITLAHFYDRIWPVRLIENGWHVATLGVECDHLGGMTTTANMRYREDCIKWLSDRNLQGRHEDPETAMYLIAEDRYLGEYRDNKHFLPCKILGDYNYVRR